MQPPTEGYYGAVDPELFHQGVYQLERAGILGPKAGQVLHSGGSVFMPAGGTWEPPPQDPRSTLLAPQRPGGGDYESPRSPSARTPLSTPATVGFAAAGLVVGKMLGSWLADR